MEEKDLSIDMQMLIETLVNRIATLELEVATLKSIIQTPQIEEEDGPELKGYM